jgi:hypothetical protein
MELSNTLRISLLSILIGFALGCMNANKEVDLAYELAKKYKASNQRYVTIIDYSKPITAQRLFVVDMKSRQVVLRSRVSHAYNSGLLYATEFSNVPGSEKSSLGAYVTGGTKIGRFGYSMYLKGLDSGINSNAYNRAIIFHSSKKMKTIWSAGCFATDEATNKKIIDLIKGGSLVYVKK